MTPQPNSETLRECAMKLIYLIRERGGMSVKIWEAASALEAAARSPAEPEGRGVTVEDAWPLPPFEQAWARKEQEGYRYGNDAIEQVRFGYKIAEAELAALESILPLSAAPSQDIVANIMRDVCECEPDDANHPETICILHDTLMMILDRNLGIDRAAPTKEKGDE